MHHVLLGIKHKTLALLAMLYCLSYGNVMAINVMHIINDNKWDIQKCWFKIPLILHICFAILWSHKHDMQTKINWPWIKKLFQDSNIGWIDVVSLRRDWLCLFIQRIVQETSHTLCLVRLVMQKLNISPLSLVGLLFLSLSVSRSLSGLQVSLNTRCHELTKQYIPAWRADG